MFLMVWCINVLMLLYRQRWQWTGWESPCQAWKHRRSTTWCARPFNSCSIIPSCTLKNRPRTNFDGLAMCLYVETGIGWRTFYKHWTKTAENCVCLIVWPCPTIEFGCKANLIMYLGTWQSRVLISLGFSLLSRCAIRCLGETPVGQFDVRDICMYAPCWLYTYLSVPTILWKYMLVPRWVFLYVLNTMTSMIKTNAFLSMLLLFRCTRSPSWWTSCWGWMAATSRRGKRNTCWGKGLIYWPDCCWVWMGRNQEIFENEGNKYCRRCEPRGPFWYVKSLLYMLVVLVVSLPVPTTLWKDRLGSLWLLTVYEDVFLSF